MASYSLDLNLLDYCIWDILQDFVCEGRRLPFANLQNLKEAIKNKRKTFRKSIAQWKKDWMLLESRMGAPFTTFSANHCYRILISCTETCWSGYFVLFGHFFAYFTVKTKAYIVVISNTVQLWLFFKNVISFSFNSVVEQYNIIAKFGTFFMIHPV